MSRCSDRESFGRERVGELQHALERLGERRGFEDLGADVAADARHAKVGQTRGAAVRGERAGVRNAEFVSRHARRDVGMGARIHVGVDAQRHRRAPAGRGRHRIEALELRLALDVEALDARFERHAHLRFRFAHAGEDHPIGAPAGREHARELPARDDVEARAHAGEKVEDREVGVRLHRVADEVVEPGEPLVEVAEGGFDRGARVDVARRAEAPRDLLERDAFEAQLARDALERAHGEEGGAVGAGGAAAGGVWGGSRSGPFCPQAARAKKAARTAAARIMPGIMNESEFHRAADAVLERIESALAAHDALDVDLEGGVLSIECPDASRIIVNRQTPNREIWVAARSGGFHFASREGAWRDTRSGEELFASLARLIEAQSGERVRWS